MFNVSILLLDNALKLAMPLTNCMINITLQQFAPLSDISQGSVTTHFRCGGIFSDSIIANFSRFWRWKNFENQLIFDKFKAYKDIVPIFLGNPVCLTWFSILGLF